MKKFQFEGGPIFLNSGGTGPDDYLVRKIGTKKWVLVIMRFGRNFTGDREAAQLDYSLLKDFFPLRHISVPENYERYHRLKAAGKLVMVSLAEFLGMPK